MKKKQLSQEELQKAYLEYPWTTLPSPRTFFEYLGYGIYIGRK